MTSKKFVIIFLSITLFILLAFSIMVFVIDPFFHYRVHSKKIAYVLNNERFQNDGIVKHFDYDAIVTGTSMVENFKISELNELFNVNGIKIPFAGAMFKEINDNLVVATNNNSNIKLIVRCLDLYKLNEPKDTVAYDKNIYPTYLYDDNIFNDIHYLLNRNAVVNAFESITRTLLKKSSTSFDDYTAWYDDYVFLEKVVKSNYIRPKKKNNYTITESDYINAYENIKQNVTDLADKYPNIDFYIFYPPYSIYYWDNVNQEGVLNLQLDCIEYVSKLLLEHKNIHLYSFLDEYDIITNLNNYKDIRHYSERINTLMLVKMKNNENIITSDNFKEKMDEMRNFYLSYNYDSLFD